MKILAETLDHPVRVQTVEYVECMGEVEQIAPLVALKQRAELGRQHFLARKSGDVRRAGEPRVIDLERDGLRRVVGLPSPRC